VRPVTIAMNSVEQFALQSRLVITSITVVIYTLAPSYLCLTVKLYLFTVLSVH
jgi:hypothetical protein